MSCMRKSILEEPVTTFNVKSRDLVSNSCLLKGKKYILLPGGQTGWKESFLYLLCLSQNTIPALLIPICVFIGKKHPSPISILLEIDLYKLGSLQQVSFQSPFALRLNRKDNCHGFCVYFNVAFSRMGHKVMKELMFEPALLLCRQLREFTRIG